jgi:peptidoglycan-associated lipoprotein
MRTSIVTKVTGLVVLVAALSAWACGNNPPPVARPMPPPAETTAGATPPARPPAPPTPVLEPPSVPPEPIRSDTISSMTLDELNRNSPLKPVFFAYDSSEIDVAGRAALADNAGILRSNATWVLTVEGHCDERGTAEYNLALGERRAVAARAYLVSLGIPAERLRTVSYGKEFPFDPGHDEAAWAKNRRAHFVITAK